MIYYHNVAIGIVCNLLLFLLLLILLLDQHRAHARDALPLLRHLLLTYFAWYDIHHGIVYQHSLILLLGRNLLGLNGLFQNGQVVVLLCWKDLVHLLYEGLNLVLLGTVGPLSLINLVFELLKLIVDLGAQVLLIGL